MQAVPQLLFYLGNTSSDTSVKALRMLLDAGRFCRPGDQVAAALDSLQPEMYPLYCRPAMPVKSSKGKQGQQDKWKRSTFAQLSEAGQVHARWLHLSAQL